MATRGFDFSPVSNPNVTSLVPNLKGSRKPPQPKLLSGAKSELSKEDVTCPVCLDRLKDPRLLPCLHVYCKTCLERILSKSKEKRRIICPQCRSSYALPSGGVGAFPSDLLLESALEFYSLKDEPKKVVSCNMCTEDDPATVYCSTCGKFLCSFCSKAHGRMLEYRDHKTVALDKLDAEAMKQFERPCHCFTHPGEPLKLYCETCKCLICRDCTIVEHRNHEFGFVKTIRPKMEKKIGELMQTVKLKQEELEANLMFVKDIGKGQDIHSATLEAEINRAFDSYIKTLESHRQQLLRQAEVTRTSNLKQVWGQKEFLEVTLASLRSVLKYSERLCHCPSDIQMLAMSTRASQCLENLEKTKWVPESDLKLSPPLAFKGANEASLRRAGDLDEITITASVVKTCLSTELGQKQQVIIKIGTKCGFLPAFNPRVNVTRNLQRIHHSYYQPHSQPIDCNVKYSGNGLWAIEFFPEQYGDYNISVVAGGKTLLNQKMKI